MVLSLSLAWEEEMAPGEIQAPPGRASTVKGLAFQGFS